MNMKGCGSIDATWQNTAQFEYIAFHHAKMQTLARHRSIAHRQNVSQINSAF